MIKATALFVLLLTLAGCSSLPPASPGDRHWQLQGRIGLWLGDQQESSQIRWLQCGDNYSQIHLSGPMGVGGAEITSTPYGAQLNYRGEIQQAASAEQLAASIGWPVPVDALRYWLRGQAAPDAPLRADVSPSGNMNALQQLGWSLNFARYNGQQGEAMPGLIEAQRDDMRIKLIVSRWSDASEACAQ